MDHHPEDRPSTPISSHRIDTTVKESSRRDARGLEPLHLAELLDFRPDQGIIRLHEQRVVILSAAAMGLMRKELIDTLGHEPARRVLLRFGFADGYHDAVNLRARSHWTTPLDGLRSGAMLHGSAVRGTRGPFVTYTQSANESRRAASGLLAEVDHLGGDCT